MICLVSDAKNKTSYTLCPFRGINPFSMQAADCARCPNFEATVRHTPSSVCPAIVLLIQSYLAHRHRGMRAEHPVNLAVGQRGLYVAPYHHATVLQNFCPCFFLVLCHHLESTLEGISGGYAINFLHFSLSLWSMPITAHSCFLLSQKSH